MLLHRPARSQKRHSPFESGWIVVKQVAQSTVLIRHQTSGAEKIVNVELVKTDAPSPADAEVEDRPVELQC